MATPTAAGLSTSSIGRRAEVPLPDLLVAAAALLLLVAFSPAVYGIFWAPKAAVLLVTIVPGAVALARLVRHRVPGARGAAAFLVVAGVSAAVSDRPVIALLGLHNWGTGWLFMLAVAGLWALGATLSPRGIDRMRAAIIGGALVVAGIAWLQTAVDLPIDALHPGRLRASSLLGNGVHVGTVSAATLALVAGGIVNARRERLVLWLVAAATLAGALQLSGSRAGLVAALFALVYGVVRLGARRGAALVAVVVLGATAADRIPKVDTASETAVGRAAVSIDPGASSGRTAVWRAAAEGILDRPVLGWGPGRAMRAISPRVGPELARNEAAGSEYSDAHNMILDYGVTTGVLGLLALAGWLVPAGRRARGPLAVFAGCGALVGLAQPQSVAVTPLLALALGAAMAAGTRETITAPPFGTRAERAIAVGGVAVSAVAAVTFLAGEVALANAATEFSRASLDRAASFLPPWPELSNVAWRIHAFEAIDTRDARAWERAVDAAGEATRRDPAASAAWTHLADLQLRAGHPRDAERSYAEAVRRYPWSIAGLNGSIHFADLRGDGDAVGELCAQRRQVLREPDDCLATVRRIYAS